MVMFQTPGPNPNSEARNRKRARDDAEFCQPTLKCKAPPCPLLRLPSELLAHITSMIDPDDELAVSLVCLEMRAAVGAVLLREEESGRKMCTSYASVSRTMALLQWAVAGGAPLSPALASSAACSLGEGSLEKVRWLREVGCPWDGRVVLILQAKASWSTCSGRARKAARGERTRVARQQWELLKWAPHSTC
jgi:hypothetical protein